MEAAVKYPADLSFLEVSSKSVNIFLNCRPDSIADIYSKTPMTADQMQVGLGQNFGEFLAPTTMVSSIQALLDSVRSIDEDGAKMVTNLGLDKLEATMQAVTDTKTIAALDMSGL